MVGLKNRAFWIAFPLAVTAVSILGVTRIRRQAAPTTPSAVTENGAPPVGAGTINPNQALLQVTVPAETEIEVRLNQAIATNKVASGDSFFATVADPVVVNGQTVIPAGAPVKGKVVSAREAGRLKGVAEIRLALESVEIEGNDYNLQSSTFTRFGHNHNKRNGEMIAGGGAGGALLGALVGHGKGALIGAPIGAGAGIAGAAFTEKRNIVIPAETAMTFQLLQPVEVHL